MSRNKDIKFLHKATGWAYKDCRAYMKKASWDLDLALKGYILARDPQIIKVIQNTAAVLIEYVDKIMRNLKPAIEKAVENITKIAVELKPVLDEITDNMRDPELQEAALEELPAYQLSHCQPVDSDPIDWEEME